MAKTDIARSHRNNSEESDYPELQRRYGGEYVARRGEDVLANAKSYADLSRDLDEASMDLEDVVIEYVEPPGLVSAY